MVIGTRNPVQAAEAWTRRGLELARLGRYLEALDPLEQALAYMAEHQSGELGRPLRSYYGLCLAMARNELERGQRLCEEAIAGGPLRAELYVNLARVALRAGARRVAVEALLTALSIAPNDRNAWTLMAELGWRRPPVLSFLPREHVFNKYLGLVRHRFAGSIAQHAL